MSSKGKSRVERRAARQRQLDMMEAEASGTAVSMDLDASSASSVDSEGRYVSIRQRNQETARRFLYDEDEALQRGPSTKNTTSTGGFATRASTTTAVNLMDHEAGLYAQQDTSFFGRMKRFFTGTDHATSEHDAMAADSEVYLGDYHHRSSRSSSSICGPTMARLRYMLYASKNRILVVLILFVAIFIVAFYCLRVLGGAPSVTPEQQLRTKNSERFNQIMDHIVLQGVSDPQHFLVSTSSQSRALRWIAYSDKARVDPDDSMILQRFALAVFFYDSFMHFQQKAGKQKPIETEDDQYEGVPVAGWKIQTNWLSNSGFCSWFGVECELRTIDGIEMRTYDDNAPIYALNLTSNYVWGEIPFEIKALHSIERLDLSKNRISGKFPPEVRYLPQLKYLYFTKNKMTGELPTEIGYMQSAVEILLDSNKFSGSIPTEINRLSNLRVLDFSDNLFNNQIPKIGGLTNLKNLHLQSNEFSGTVPFSVSELHELRELYIDMNKFKGTLAPEMESLENLRVFSAHENMLSGMFPSGILESNRELQHVTINHNRFTGALPTWEGALEQLETLDMHDNLFSGTFPTQWTNMPKLQVLHLQNNRVSGNIPPTIGSLTSVKELWLSNNTITGPVPAELGSCSSLEFAYLQYNKLSGALPDELGNLRMLETMRLESNSFTGFLPQQVCNLKSFDRLKYVSSDCESGQIQCSCCDRCF
ncbi:hypothetical protein ACA910_022487 [Epithemia clementina (nom. ined.)]